MRGESNFKLALFVSLSNKRTNKKINPKYYHLPFQSNVPAHLLFWDVIHPVIPPFLLSPVTILNYWLTVGISAPPDTDRQLLVHLRNMYVCACAWELSVCLLEHLFWQPPSEKKSEIAITGRPKVLRCRAWMCVAVRASGRIFCMPRFGKVIVSEALCSLWGFVNCSLQRSQTGRRIHKHFKMTETFVQRFIQQLLLQCVAHC